MERLTDNERRIMAAIGARADIPHAEVAQLTGLKPHQVRHSLARLTARRLVRRHWIIDTFRIGLPRFALYFSLNPALKHRKMQVIEKVRADPRIIVLQENGGTYDFELTALAPSHAEFLDLLDSFSGAFGGALTGKSIAARVHLVHFPRKYLAPLKSYAPGLEMGGGTAKIETDDLDIAILRSLAAEPDRSFREIARALGRPESTVSARLVRLRKEGVLAGLSYRTYPEQYGYQIYKLLITARGYDKKFRNQLLEFARAHPLCTYYTYSLGEWDFELGIESRERVNVIEVRDEVAVKFGAHVESVRVIARFKNYKNVPI